MYAELYKSKTLYHGEQEIGAIYYGNNLLWKKPVIRKYNFSDTTIVGYLNYYHMNKIRLYRDDDNTKPDKIRVEYQNCNMFNMIQVLDTEFNLMSTNKTSKNDVIEGGFIQINKKSGDIFFISDNNIIVNDKFGNKLGEITILEEGEINNILVDFDKQLLYVFLDKVRLYGYDEDNKYPSILKYSFKIDNFYTDIN